MALYYHGNVDDNRKNEEDYRVIAYRHEHKKEENSDKTEVDTCSSVVVWVLL